MFSIKIEMAKLSFIVLSEKIDLLFGLGPFSRAWAQFLPIRTSYSVNNIYIYIYIYTYSPMIVAKSKLNVTKLLSEGQEFIDFKDFKSRFSRFLHKIHPNICSRSR